MFGEAIGCQPHHGFIDGVDFQQPIKRITACLGSHKCGNKNLVGLLIESLDRQPVLLGKYRVLGPYFELEDHDSIVGFTVRLGQIGNEQPIEEIIFVTNNGDRKGFCGDKLTSESEDSKEIQVFKSSKDLSLGGLIWSFDIGWNTAGDHGIQPLYFSTTDTVHANIQHILYPSLVWARAPPSNILLRPIPAMEAELYPVTSSLFSSDDLNTFSDFKISSIRVYFNTFLQGIVLCFKDGQTRSIGNTVGVEGVIEVDEERVFSIWLRPGSRFIIFIFLLNKSQS